MLQHFSKFNIERSGVRLHGRAGGQGEPLLLLHGHPKSHVMWHLVALQLAGQFTVVIEHGAVGQCFDVLALWLERAPGDWPRLGLRALHCRGSASHVAGRSISIFQE